MIEPTEKLRNIIAFGWTGMLLANIASFMMRIIINGAESLGGDAGMAGVLVVFFYIFILMPISVKTFEAITFRWTAFGVTVLYTLLFSAHFFTNLFIIGAPVPIVMLFALIPILGIWSAVTAFKWARSRPEEN